MRIISFSKMWEKLKQSEFTTFRLPRKDADRGFDWHLGEEVQIYYKSRSPERQKLGEAIIVSIVPRCIEDISEDEAKADGFGSWQEMWEWLKKTHFSHKDRLIEPMNKITLRYK